MSLGSDLIFSIRPRCPKCQRGRLFKAWALTVVDECAECHAKLGQHDVGDGASVLLIFLLGFSIIPMAWAFELAFAPPLWVHVVVWGIAASGIIAVVLPMAKAYIILLEYRHRKKN